MRVYLDPPEELRRHWKVQRDCSRRGYTTDQVLSELDRREPDSERGSGRSGTHADIVVSFQPGDTEDQEHLDCKLTLCDSLPHPDLTGVVAEDGDGGIVLSSGRRRRSELYVPGRLPPERASAIEEAIWEKMHFARHLREERLGEFTIGTDLHRSDSLAVVQLLILYHMVTARAVVSLGGVLDPRVRSLDARHADRRGRALAVLVSLPARSRSPVPEWALLVVAIGPAVLAVVVVVLVWRWAKRSRGGLRRGQLSGPRARGPGR